MLWTKSGKIIVDSSGKAIDCSKCPCEKSYSYTLWCHRVRTDGQENSTFISGPDCLCLKESEGEAYTREVFDPPVYNEWKYYSEDIQGKRYYQMAKSTAECYGSCTQVAYTGTPPTT